MKKRHKILPLLGIAVLSSCAKSYGQEISDKTQINELQNAISVRMSRVSCYQVTTKMLVSSKDAGSEEQNFDIDVTYGTDYSANQYLWMSYKLNKIPVGAYSLYEVTDKSHGKVIYYEQENYSDEESYAYAVFPDKENKQTESGQSEVTFESYVPTYAILVLELFYEVRDPLYYAKFIDENPDPGLHIKYFSKGEGNLTVEYSKIEIGIGSTYSNHLRMTYSDYLLESAEMETKSKNDYGSRNEKYELTFALTDSSISLPNGWEDKIQEN